MRDDHHRFLTLLGQLPARLNAEQAAWVLNCQPHDVPILVSVRLLKPLGSPQPNSVKYFATADVLELTKDRTWLAKVTNAVSLHWKQKKQHKAIRAELVATSLALTLPPLPSQQTWCTHAMRWNKYHRIQAA